MDKDTRQLLSKLVKQNFTWEYTPNGHIKVYPPDRSKFVIMPQSPSCSHGKKKDRVRLRKLGFKDR